MQAARVSITIPAYNGAEFLGQTIAGVQAQTFPGWELVVVNDGSTDNTGDAARAVAERDARIRVVDQANAGVGAARNRGPNGRSSDSEFVIFLDQDDVWEKDALEVLIMALDRHPSAVAANGLSRTIDRQGELITPGELEMWGRQRWGVAGARLIAWPLHWPTTLRVLAFGNCIYTPGQVLIRRLALEAAGPFDADISPADDWDMWLRLSALGDIAFLDRVVLNWRAHVGNGSQQRDRIFEFHAHVRSKVLRSPGLSGGQRRIALAANWFWAREVRRRRLHRMRVLFANGEARPAMAQFSQVLANYAHCVCGVPVPAPSFRPTLKELYRTAHGTPSDISEHLASLRELARQCRHVTELGTRAGTSTTAILSGHPPVLVTYDRERWPAVDMLEGVARESRRTRFVFQQADVLEVEIDETDMLFIDTWHVYEQLKQELALHARKVRKYLVLHDTTTYGEVGESPGHRGLWPAIEEFLWQHPDWSLAARLTNNNGLTILTRAGNPAPSLSPSKRPRRPAYRSE
ncbi:MAG: glycosyltransferase [Dehalococcoidia bacterium]